MAKLGRLIAAAAICVLPLAAGAQSTTPTDKSSTTKVVPGEQPRANPDQQTRQDTGEAPKNGQSGSQSGPEPSSATTDAAMSKSKMKTKRTDKMGKTDQTATGDSTTYPAKTKDGRPTSDSNVKSTPAN
ncbi:MAG: hypothetical protein ACR2GP_04945 [Burkholderiaceae bacterium]